MIVDCHAHVFTHWIGACGPAMPALGSQVDDVGQ